MRGNTGYAERSAEIYLPYVGHVADDVLLLQDGSVCAIGHVAGVPFELEELVMRNSRLRTLNTLFRNIADDNVTITAHLVRHEDRDELPPGRFRSGFMADLDRAYRERVLRGRLFRNDHYLTILISPRNVLGKTGSRIARLARRGAEPTSSERDRRTLEDVWQI
ncbi:MAG: type secretion system protein VirB4, partial [Aliidongia sp.]|nr:type secretion system protein VirB4 [Aliidongia sp.]